MKKETHLEINPQKCTTDFFILPEMYNTQKIHTHNLSIYFNGKLVDITESDNEDLIRLNMIFRIYSTNKIIKVIYEIIEFLKKDLNYKRISKEMENFQKNYNDFFNRLVDYYHYYAKDFLKNPKPASFSKLTYNNAKKCFMNAFLKLESKKSKLSKESMSKIVKLRQATELLIDVKNEQLIAIELPKYYSNKKVKFHCTITIETEELYTGCAFYRKNARVINYFTGERAEFMIGLAHFEGSSSYYEIIPPEKTRISKVYSTDNISNCSIMMFKKKKKKNNRIKFIENYNERFVVHIPRDKSKEPRPRFRLIFAPNKMIQVWVFLSLLLGIINILLILTLLLDNNWHFLNLNLLSFQDILKYLVPLIYGLIIGNNLLLQEPKFLWKKTTYTSIVLIMVGILLNCLFLFQIALI
ncbi:MAG: hypothetical protein ACTSRZ_20030 [Promethearchaeota archaeon]